MACLEQQERKETRVQLVSLDFQVWRAYLGTQGPRGPEANLDWMVSVAQEVIRDFQEKEELLVQEAPLVTRGKMEKKEGQCSFQVALKVFRETAGTKGCPAYQDPGVHKDQQGPWGMLVHQGQQDL